MINIKSNCQKKALIISVSEYNQLHALSFCVNDGLGIFNILSKHNYEFHKGRDLIGRVNGIELRDNLVNFFADPSISQDDLLLFYFSGHGYYHHKTKENFLASSDFDKSNPQLRGVSFDFLTKLIKDCVSDKVVIIIDCCYSGALDHNGKGETTTFAELAENAMSRQAKELDYSIGRCILASSLDEQLSFKKKDADYSVFSYYVIKGLEGKDSESVDVKGNVTVNSLGRYLTKSMMTMNKFKQRPIIKYEMSGDIVIVEYPHLARSTVESSVLLELLKKNRSQDFNKLRNITDRLDFSNIELEDIIIDGFNLSVTNFEHSKFTRVQIQNSDLSSCNFAPSIFNDVKLFNCNLTNCHFSGSIINSSSFSNVRLDYSRILSCQLNNCGFENCALYYTAFGINNEIYPTLEYSPTFLNTVGFSDCQFYETVFSGTNLFLVGIGGGLFYDTDFKCSKLESVAIKSHFAGLINFNYSYIQGVSMDIKSGLEDTIITFTGSYYDNFDLNTATDPLGQFLVFGFSELNLKDKYPVFFEFIRQTNTILLNKPNVTINQKIQIRKTIYFVMRKLLGIQLINGTEGPQLAQYDFQYLMVALLAIRDDNNDIYFPETKSVFDLLGDFMKEIGFSLESILKDIITKEHYPSSVAQLSNSI